MTVVWGSIPSADQALNDQHTTLKAPFGGVSQHIEGQTVFRIGHSAENNAAILASVINIVKYHIEKAPICLIDLEKGT